MDIDELLRLDRNGLIPGPEETAESFQERVKYCLSLKSELLKQFDLPHALETQEDQKIIQEAAPTTKKLFGFAAEWVPLIFSNYKLAPWHGGCAWIFQLTDSTPMGAFLQLRTGFAKASRYFFYNRSELIAHELSHVGRLAYQEPIFEEILAYRTSESKFRRWWGPIVKSSWEALLFVFLLMISLSFDLYAFFNPALYSLAMQVKLLPLTLLLVGIGRLWLRQSQFHKCLKKIKNLTSSSEAANAVIYRLTDKEIISFSKLSNDEISQYIKEQNSLRWKVITAILKM